MQGVTAVEANPVSQTTTVTFDDSKIKVKDILRELRNERYTVLGEPKYIK